MLAAILIGATLTQEPTVTFTHPCAHSAVVLKALGKEIGMTLKPRGSVDKDYFLVRFEDTPVQEALDRIAETLNATWQGDGKVRYLDRTRDDMLEEIEMLFSVIDEFIANNPVEPYPTITELVPQLVGADSLDVNKESDRAKYTDLTKFSPMRRALVKVLRSFTKQELEQMFLQDETSFYATPLEFERPFTRPMVTALQDMFKEYEVLREAAVRAGISPSENYIPNYLKLLRPGGLDNVDFGFVVDLSDRDFAVRIRNGDRLPYYGYEAIEDRLRVYREPPYPELEGTDVPHIVKPEHLAFFKSLAKIIEYENTEQWPELPSWTRNALLDLEKHEPLGMLTSDVLLQLADLKGWDMVALLQDGSLIPLDFTPASNLRDATELILGWHVIGLDETGDFASITPYDPRMTRLERWDRKTISQAIRLCNRRKWFDLEAQAMVYDTYTDDTGGADLEYTLHALFGKYAGVSTEGPSDMGLHRLYNQLPAQFRQRAKFGPVETPVTTMDQTVRRTVREILRHNDIQSQERAGLDLFTYWHSDTSVGDTLATSKYSTTELTDDIVIKLRHETRLSFIGKPYTVGLGSSVTPLMSVDELARDYLRAIKEKFVPDLKQVMLLPSERVVLTISIPEGELSATFVTAGLAMTDGYVTHDRLPLAIRTELRKAIAKRGG